MRSIRRLLVVGFAMACAPARAFADVPVFPERPEWDDVPLPMPSELGWIVVTVALVALLSLARHRDGRDRG